MCTCSSNDAVSMASCRGAGRRQSHKRLYTHIIVSNRILGINYSASTSYCKFSAASKWRHGGDFDTSLESPPQCSGLVYANNYTFVCGYFYSHFNSGLSLTAHETAKYVSYILFFNFVYEYLFVRIIVQHPYTEIEQEIVAVKMLENKKVWMKRWRNMNTFT